MKLSVIIVNYKTPEMTLDAASAALDQLKMLDCNWQLTIVDNDSQDGSFEKLQNSVDGKTTLDRSLWERVDVLQSGFNGGFGAGNNFGIKHQLKENDQVDYFYILNSDAFPEEGSIKYLMDYLDAHHDVGIAGSYIHGPDNEPHATAFRFPSALGEFECAIGFGPITRLLKNSVVPMGIPEATQEVDWLAGASMMIRCTVLEQVGLFDEGFFLYYEETDFCRRAKNNCWSTVYVKESSVCHIGSVTTGMKEWKRIHNYWFDSRRRYFIKSYGNYYYYLATCLRIIGELLYKLRAFIFRKKSVKPAGFTYDLTKHMLTNIF